MKASDIMSTKVISIDGLATITEAARVMKHHQIRALIVDRISDDDAYGMITVTDISQAVASGRDPQTTYVCEVMTKPCIVVNPDLAVEYIAKLFARAKIRVAPVIKGKLLGIVSLSDILTNAEPQAKEPKQKRAKLSFPLDTIAELPLDETIDREWQSELDFIYENWCSG